MQPHMKAPTGATNTDQGNEILRTGISTNNDTRTSQGTRKPKRRTWHIHTGYTDDGLPKGLCGWVSPGRDFLTSSTAPEKTDECIPRECPDCAEIVRMQKAAVRREQRALELAKFILNHLDEKA